MGRISLICIACQHYNILERSTNDPEKLLQPEHADEH